MQNIDLMHREGLNAYQAKTEVELLLIFTSSGSHDAITITTQKHYYVNHVEQIVFQFEVIINVSSVGFIWIPMLWV